jgi:dihydroorotase
VTTEAYPYTAGMTEIQSANLDEYVGAPAERLARLEWPSTGERLTRESFEKYRKIGGPVVLHTNTEEMVKAAVTSPLTMIASDAYWENGIGHPRTTGTYSKVLGRYVRGQQALTLMDAIRKMTLMPARRLEARVPAMKTKGRLRTGADADIAVIDPATVIARPDRDPSRARQRRRGRRERPGRGRRDPGAARARVGVPSVTRQSIHMSSPAPIALLAGEPLGARVMWVNGFVAFPSP